MIIGMDSSHVSGVNWDTSKCSFQESDSGYPSDIAGITGENEHPDLLFSSPILLVYLQSISGMSIRITFYPGISFPFVSLFRSYVSSVLFFPISWPFCLSSVSTCIPYLRLPTSLDMICQTVCVIVNYRLIGDSSQLFHCFLFLFSSLILGRGKTVDSQLVVPLFLNSLIVWECDTCYLSVLMFVKSHSFSSQSVYWLTLTTTIVNRFLFLSFLVECCYCPGTRDEMRRGKVLNQEREEDGETGFVISLSAASALFCPFPIARGDNQPLSTALFPSLPKSRLLARILLLALASRQQDVEGGRTISSQQTSIFLNWCVCVLQRGSDSHLCLFNCSSSLTWMRRPRYWYLERADFAVSDFLILSTLSAQQQKRETLSLIKQLSTQLIRLFRSSLLTLESDSLYFANSLWITINLNETSPLKSPLHHETDIANFPSTFYNIASFLLYSQQTP